MASACTRSGAPDQDGGRSEGDAGTTSPDVGAGPDGGAADAGAEAGGEPSPGHVVAEETFTLGKVWDLTLTGCGHKYRLLLPPPASALVGTEVTFRVVEGASKVGPTPVDGCVAQLLPEPLPIEAALEIEVEPPPADQRFWVINGLADDAAWKLAAKYKDPPYDLGVHTKWGFGARGGGYWGLGRADKWYDEFFQWWDIRRKEAAPMCFGEVIYDTDYWTDGLQADCEVVARAGDPGGGPDTPIPSCDAATPPCFRLVLNATDCAASGIELVVDWGDAEPGRGRVGMRCQT